MKKGKLLTGILMAGVILTAGTVSGFAAEVDQNNPSASQQQTITFVKTQEEVVPVYTVEIPASVELGKDSTKLTYSLNLEDHSAFIPEGKKVSVKIESAGYPTVLNKFALWDSRHLQEATYKLYDSDNMANPAYYEIGDEIVSWEGSDWGTVTRMARLDDYSSLGAGTYSGVINYAISLEDK